MIQCLNKCHIKLEINKKKYLLKAVYYTVVVHNFDPQEKTT